MKVLLFLADPERTLTVCLSEDRTVVSVALVGQPLRFKPSTTSTTEHIFPTGYWEFEGRVAELIADRCTIKDPWDALLRAWENLPEAIL